MKKWIKYLLITFGVIALIIVLFLYYSISFIDTEPYFTTHYYKNTIESLNKTLADRESNSAKLFTGFSKVNITPIIVTGEQNPQKGRFNKIRLAGYGDGQHAIGIHDSIYAKAIAIKVDKKLQLLISADLLLTPPKVVEKVEEKLAQQNIIEREQIIFGATHTHASIGNCIPSFVGGEFGGEFQPEVVEWLSEKYIYIIKNSIADLKLSKFANGYLHAPKLISNRIIGETGRLNDRFAILSFKQNNGRSAVIGIYAAHATVLGAWNDQFSGDYPGYFQRALELSGIDQTMFFAGPVGSHTNRGVGSKFERSKYIGEALADSAKIVLQNLNYSSKVTISTIYSEIEIPKLQVIYISENLRLSPEAGQQLLPEITSSSIQSFTINNFLWIAMPCELSGEYALDLQNALELKGFNSAITSFNGQYLGYVVPAKYYNYDYYESRLMGWFGPSMGDYLMELNFTIADSLTGFKL